ncbi:STY4534 family ICE replication protein [Pseudomonas sp. LB3P25]
MSTTHSDSSYFDLHITGLGYLNRIREVKPKKGETFLACDIAALNGPTNSPEYRRFDVRVSGTEAQQLVRRCVQAVEAQRKVLIGFRLGDLWSDTFTYSKGARVGQQGVSLKARLLVVSWIKIDGDLVHNGKPSGQENGGTDRPPEPSPVG